MIGVVRCFVLLYDGPRDYSSVIERNDSTAFDQIEGDERSDSRCEQFIDDKTVKRLRLLRPEWRLAQDVHLLHVLFAVLELRKKWQGWRMCVDCPGAWEGEPYPRPSLHRLVHLFMISTGNIKARSPLTVQEIAVELWQCDGILTRCTDGGGREVP
jgi:hypothetical protein